MLRDLLSSGDLTTDGMADEATRIVLANMQLLPELVSGLHDKDGAVRGHTADALEKLARSQPAALLPYLALLLKLAHNDPLPMVRWHMAMLFGHVSMFSEWVERLQTVLLALLDDPSVFTQNWAIVSLCILARQYPGEADKITPRVAALARSDSAAIRTKVSKAMPLLMDQQRPFPKGWIKSEHLLARLCTRQA